jgi:hypothetical protein
MSTLKPLSLLFPFTFLLFCPSLIFFQIANLYWPSCTAVPCSIDTVFVSKELSNLNSNFTWENLEKNQLSTMKIFNHIWDDNSRLPENYKEIAEAQNIINKKPYPSDDQIIAMNFLQSEYSKILSRQIIRANRPLVYFCIFLSTLIVGIALLSIYFNVDFKPKS